MIRNRGELCAPLDQLNLIIQFKDTDGTPIDADSFPKISLVQPNGMVALAPTSAGISKIGTGRYSYVFDAPINGPLGVWNDIWSAYINGFLVQQQFEFILSTTDMPGVNVDGYIRLGDDPGFDYSQLALGNINKLLKSLRARLNSSGMAKSADSFGNTMYVSCDIFSVDMLTTFLATALWQFNQVPYFTSFKFDDTEFVEQFGEILVEGATLYALASKALIQKGAEFTITDNGINFNPPTVSDMMMTQYSALLTAFNETLKYIKNSIRPHPRSLGVWSMSGGMNAAIRRLRHLRQRQIL